MNVRSAQDKVNQEADKENKLDAKSDQVRDKDRDRHHQAREINLAEDVRIGQEGIRSAGQAVGKETPQNRSGHGK